MSITNKVVKLSLDEFSNLEILDPDVIYVVDNKSYYSKYDGKTNDILKYVNVDYFCNNYQIDENASIYSKEYIAGEKIDLPFKYDLNIAQAFNENTYNEYLIFKKWYCDNNEVSNFAPYDDKAYYSNGFKIKITNYSIIDQINTYNQNVNLGIKIESDIPIYLKKQFLDSYHIDPIIIDNTNSLSNATFNKIINYTIKPIEKITSSKELIFKISLYEDINCIKKLLDTDIKILVNVSNESSGD